AAEQTVTMFCPVVLTCPSGAGPGNSKMAISVTSPMTKSPLPATTTGCQSRRGGWLAGARLAGARLAGASLAGAWLTGSRLAGCWLMVIDCSLSAKMPVPAGRLCRNHRGAVSGRQLLRHLAEGGLGRDGSRGQREGPDNIETVIWPRLGYDRDIS